MNVITLGKLIGCFFSSVSPSSLSFVFENKRNDLARPVMGTIFLVSVCRYVGMSVCRYVGMSVCLSYVKLTA